MPLILVFAMIVTMIPQTVFAENSNASDGYLAYRYASWSAENENYYGDSEKELWESWNMDLNSRSNVIFYYVEEGVETEIPLEELIISDSSVVSLSEEWCGGALLMEAVGFGHSTIGYIKDGVEYVVDINVELSTVAFYTEPTVSESSYIQKFTVTKENNTFYYVAKEGWQITTYEVEGDCKEYATVSLSDDKTYLTIQMDEDTPDGWVNILCDIENEGDWEGHSSSIDIERDNKQETNVPEFYFYTKPEVNEEYKITENVITITKDNNKFYYVVTDDYVIENIELPGIVSDVASAVISENGKYVEITVFDTFEMAYFGMIVEVSNGEETITLPEIGIELFQEFEQVEPEIPEGPALMAYQGLYSDGVVDEMPEEGLHDSILLPIGRRDYYFFYYVQDGELNSVQYDQLSVSDESIVKLIKCEENKNAVIVKILRDGEATINYTINGVTYSMEVYTFVDMLGFFTKPEQSAKYGIAEFTVTNDEDTFYLLASEFIHFANVSLSEEFEVIADAAIDPNDDNVIKIQVTGTPEDGKDYKVYAQTYLTSADSCTEGEWIITLYNGKTSEGPEVPEGVDYAPCYDSETGKILGIKVGDTVEVGTVFSSCNLAEYESLRLGYKGYENDRISSYSKVTAGATYTVDEPDGNFDPANGMTVSDVRYSEGDIYIEMMANVPPKKISPLSISVDWNMFKNFKSGMEVPNMWDAIEAFDIEGEGVEGIELLSFKFKVQEDHVTKGFIDESEYNLAIEQYDGWWSADNTHQPFIIANDDEFAVEMTVCSEFGYVFSYDGEDISDSVQIKSNGIVLNYADPCMGMYSNMNLDADIYLGTAKEIYERAVPTVTYKGWKQLDGKWYYFDENGNKVTNQWKQDSAGWCYLGEDGAMITNQWVKDSVGWCYVDASGYMVYNQWAHDGTGWAYAGVDGYRETSKWIKDSAGWCYVDESGYMVYSQWVADSKGDCYVSDTGYMATNQWIETEEGWCFVETTGYKAVNKWHKKDGEWCYLGAEGYMVTNDWAKDGSYWCYLDENGYMVKDKWIDDGNGECYLDANGHLITSRWMMVDGEWCYVGASGYVVTSAWVKDSVGWCYLDEEGHMVYDQWVADSKGLCYVGTNGYMATKKWVQHEGNWSYVGADGYKVKDKWVKDSVGWCYLDSEGFMVYNMIVSDSVGACYVDDTGYMVYDQWITIGEFTYYINPSGYASVGWVSVDGNWYYFYEDGVMARNKWVDNNYYVDENGIWIP